MPSRSLTDSEINQIVAHMDSKRDRALFVLGCKTGFRISELLSLCISDVSQKDSSICDNITVRRCNMKGKSVSRTVPLHDKAKEALSLYIHSVPLISTSKLFPISRIHAWRILKAATNALQLKGKVSTHSMRKSFAMGVYERTNKDIVATQKALGHASLASTSHYLDVNRDTVDAAILSG